MEITCYCGAKVPLFSDHIRGRLMHNYGCSDCGLSDEQFHFTTDKAEECFMGLVRREERS